MPAYSHKGTYQGKDLLAWSVDRKPGLSSDSAWVEMLVDDLGGIELNNSFRPWVEIHRKEPPGPMSMFAALRVLGGPGQTATQPPGSSSQKAGVLKRGGDLVLETTAERGGPGGPKDGDEPNLVKLSPMFVAPSGIREVETNLAAAQLHNQGRIRVGLVDIRHWWDKVGTPVWGDYNITNRYGRFDKAYLDRATEEASPLSDFFKYLCFCLPGSPILHPSSVVFSESFNPPQNIRMRFELPSLWMWRLLDAYGLELHLTHDSNVVITRRLDSHEVGKFVRVPGGTAKGISVAPNEEKKTVFAVDRPEGVFVSGGRRSRRISVQCAPAFVDEDGQIKLMEDLPAIWGDGFTIQEAMKERLMNPAGAYAFLPGKDARQVARRRKIALQYFFKFYIPRTCIDPDSKTIRTLWNFGEKEHPLMPMKNPVFHVDEAKALVGVPSSVTADDEAVLVELDYVVRGRVIKEDFSNDLEDFKKKINAQLEALKERRDVLSRRQDFINKAIAEIDKGAPTYRITDTQKLLGILDDQMQVKAAAEFVAPSLLGAIVPGIRKKLEEDAAWNAQANAVRGSYLADLKTIQEKLTAIAKAEKEVKSRISEAVEGVKAHQYTKMWVNVPWGILEKDSVNVDPRTGAITLNQIGGMMDAPAVRDLETAELIADADIEITYNHEVKNNRANDFGYWAFMGSEDPSKGATLCEISEPTGLKAALYRDESLVIYHGEDGQPLNLQQTTEKAARAAAAAMKEVLQKDGYEYRYPGLWKIVTEWDQNEVVWTFDGDRAYTYIFCNHPDGSADGWASLTKKKEREALIYRQWEQR